jgi:hypothetical protein
VAFSEQDGRSCIVARIVVARNFEHVDDELSLPKVPSTGDASQAAGQRECR